ncbi:hypothetical protein [Euzebya rosea]|uniref:hypothetical protein n=1 Tax=Euzebya rosea TaxID=2052804 RepID=UPI000D3E0EF6|nr:hypothetical protein [Euzebya rosea]
MDQHDISDFIDRLDDPSGFEAGATRTATAMPALIQHRRAGRVDDWLALAADALRACLRDGWQPPSAHALLQTPDAVRTIEAEPCCETSWFMAELNRTAATLPDVWVALAVPDSEPHGIPVGYWNPANRGPVDIDHVRFYAEVRGRGLGLPRGVSIRTARLALDDGPVDLTPTDDASLRRLGRRILHRHPIRRR